MKMLEQKAQQLAAEAEQDRPKPKEKILFVRFVWVFYMCLCVFILNSCCIKNLKKSYLSNWFLKFDYIFQSEQKQKPNPLFLPRSDTSRSELAELSKQANPDEIDIDDDDDEDEDNEDQGPDGE